MRIFSEFHDYYDVVQATGQDQTVVYQRKLREEPLSGWPFPFCKAVTAYYRWRDTLLVRQSIIGFAGKIYPLLRLSHRDEPSLCYNLEEVDHFVESRFSPKEIEAYRATKGGYNRNWPGSQNRRWFQEFFEECTRRQNSYTKWFEESHCPVWVADYGRQSKMTYNPVLKEMQFYRIVDTYTAYQEIFMYLGSLAVPLKEVPEISDRDMRDAKGFDKWSFKKPPSK